MSKPNMGYTEEQFEIFRNLIKQHIGKANEITSVRMAEEWFGVKVTNDRDYAFVRALVHDTRVDYDVFTSDGVYRVLCADHDGYFLAKNAQEAMRYALRFRNRNRKQSEAEDAVWEGVERMFEQETQRE